MDAKVQAQELISSQTTATTSPALSSGERADSPVQAQAPVAALPDPTQEFDRQLEEIISTYGSAASLMEKKQPLMLEPDSEPTCETDEDYVLVSTETGGAAKDQQKMMKGLGKEASLLMQSLNKLKTPQEKLDTVVKKYADMVEERRGDQRQLKYLQQKQGHMTKERDLFQAERSRDALARCRLEELCRELQRYNKTLQEESLKRSRQDEEKRNEISCHFQTTLTEIQAQIEQHSNRNNKLCQENANLAEKLKSIINQYEAREESLEKIFKHRDLQQQLADAKVEQASALLQEAQEKHKREREYLLREAIDKTKKCCTMKEQELQLKKKLVLYSQKFEEFQTTLSKSNDVYASFKQEMEKMTKKMNKLEKESGVWKTRFEECNKTLVEMIDERSVKEKEFGFFTVKIDKLEKLCQALQDERKVLYGKIKEIRMANTTQISGQDEGSVPGENPSPLPSSELQEKEELEEEEPVLTEEMARLKVEQTRLQEFVTSLLNPSSRAAVDEEDDDDDEDDDGENDNKDLVREEEGEGTAKNQSEVKVQKSQSQSEVKVPAQPQSQLEVKVQTESQSQSEVKVPSQPQSQLEVKVEAESQSQSEVRVHARPQSQPQVEPQVQKSSEPEVVPEQVNTVRPAAELAADKPILINPAPEPENEPTPEVTLKQTPQSSGPVPEPEPVRVEAEAATQQPKPVETEEEGKSTPTAPEPQEKTQEIVPPKSEPRTSSSSSSDDPKEGSQLQPAMSGSSKKQTPKKKNAKKAI